MFRAVSLSYAVPVVVLFMLLHGVIIWSCLETNSGENNRAEISMYECIHETLQILGYLPYIMNWFAGFV